jgi:hypothetical protein
MIYTYLPQICQRVQKGVLLSARKIYNHLPWNIKALSKDVKQFKPLLRSYLTEHAFYTVDEYYKKLPNDFYNSN